MARTDDFTTEVREDVRKLWAALNDLKQRLQFEYNTGGYGTGGANEIPDNPPGANSDLTRAEIGAAVFDTTDALMAVLTANSNAHGANLQRLL